MAVVTEPVFDEVELRGMLEKAIEESLELADELADVVAGIVQVREAASNYLQARARVRQLRRVIAVEAGRG